VLTGLDQVSGLIDAEMNAPGCRSAPVDVEAIPLSDDRIASLFRHKHGLWTEWLALWNALPPSDRDAAAHPAWLTAWLRNYTAGAGRDIRLFVCRAAGELLAVLPFEVLPKTTPLGRACQLRLECISPLEGASLAVNRTNLERVCAAIFNATLDGEMRPAAIVLDKVDETHSLLRSPGLHCCAEEVEPRSVIELADGYDSLHESLSGNFRGNLRKARNKLNKLVGLRLDEIMSPCDIPSGLERFAAVERRSWKAREGTDLAGDAAMYGFYRDALAPLAASGQALIHVLQADGIDLAAQIALQFGDRLDVHKISFAEQYEDMSPGNLLLERVLRDAAPRHGITRANLVTHLPWHARWNPGLIRTWRVRIFPRGVRGVWSRIWFVPPKERARAWLDRTGLLAPLRNLKVAGS
jgi:CelD/BcsL family acetyltransferase involved in cellulose biosynthesis